MPRQSPQSRSASRRPETRAAVCYRHNPVHPVTRLPVPEVMSLLGIPEIEAISW